MIVVLSGKENSEMAKQTELSVSPREIMGKASKHLREKGILPANIFGHGEAPQAIQLEAAVFEELRRKHHTTGVIELHIAGIKKAQTALIRHVQREPRKGKVLHIDFLRVNLRDRI